MVQKLTRVALRKSIAIHLDTDAQAYRILLAVPDLDPVSTASALRAVIAGGDPLKASKLLKKDDLWTRVAPTIAAQMKSGLAQLLAIKRRPDRELVEAMRANPKGETRRILLNLINQKASSAEKTLNSGAVLSLTEKERLALTALRPRAHAYRPTRALMFMEHTGWSPKLRKLLLDCLSQGSDGMWKSLAIFQWSKDRFFPDAPITEAERASLVSKMLMHDSVCVHLLIQHGTTDPDTYLQLKEAEVQLALERVIQRVQSHTLNYHQRMELERVLANPHVMTYVSTAQKNILSQAAELKAA